MRALLAFMWAHPGKQLLFQGQEFGQEREWSESRSLDWHLLEEPLHAGHQGAWSATSTGPTRACPRCGRMDVTPDGFSWIDANDASGNVLSFLRNGVGRRRQAGGDGLRRELLRHAEAGLPGRAAVRRPLAGGAQHRRAGLRRLRGGQPRRGRGRAADVARPAGVGGAAAAAVRGAVAGAGAGRRRGPRSAAAAAAQADAVDGDRPGRRRPAAAEPVASRRPGPVVGSDSRAGDRRSSTDRRRRRRVGADAGRRRPRRRSVASTAGRRSSRQPAATVRRSGRPTSTDRGADDSSASPVAEQDRAVERPPEVGDQPLGRPVRVPGHRDHGDGQRHRGRRAAAERDQHQDPGPEQHQVVVPGDRGAQQARPRAPRTARCRPGRCGPGGARTRPACRPAPRPRAPCRAPPAARSGRRGPGSEALSTVSGTGSENAIFSHSIPLDGPATSTPSSVAAGGRGQPGPQRQPAPLHGREQQQRAERRLERHRDPVQHRGQHRPAAPLGDPARPPARPAAPGRSGRAPGCRAAATRPAR